MAGCAEGGSAEVWSAVAGAASARDAAVAGCAEGGSAEVESAEVEAGRGIRRQDLLWVLLWCSLHIL